MFSDFVSWCMIYGGNKWYPTRQVLGCFVNLMNLSSPHGLEQKVLFLASTVRTTSLEVYVQYVNVYSCCGEWRKERLQICLQPLRREMGRGEIPWYGSLYGTYRTSSVSLSP